MTEMANIPLEKDMLLLRINRTVELIHTFDKGIRLSKSLDAPKSLIEQDEEMKSRLVNELLTLLSEMNINVELKIAA
jgi:hypothetical protein